MKKLVLSLAMVLGVAFAFGQQQLTKEELKQQKRQIKALMGIVNDAEVNLHTDPVAANNSLKPVLKNPLVNKDAYVWYVSANAKKAVIDQENNKRVEGAAYDEEKLYSYTYEIGKDLKMCEECDQLPDKKGKVKPRYGEFLKTSYMQQYGQFYNAGAYYYGNEEYKKAYDLFEMFIYTADKLYQLDVMAKDTTNVPVAAYNMALCGMQLEDYKMVLTHVDLAMANEQMAPTAFRYKAVATVELGDTLAWLDICKEGTQRFPEDVYFSQSLIQYYDSRNESDKLNALADELIAADPSNPLFVYLKGYIPHQKEDYDTAIEWYHKTLEVDPDYENALANLARCYLQKAYLYSVEHSSTKLSDKKKIAKDKEIMSGFYKNALPLLERLRTNCPDKTELWLANLINCYYNLNMSKEVKELEKLQEELGY